MSDKRLSVVVPCRNEAACVRLFQDALGVVLSQIDVPTEVIYVDDGSTDGTLEEIRKLSSYRVGELSRCSAKQIQLDESKTLKLEIAVRYLSLSRGFGKEAAMLAGLRAAQGDWVVTMDADLQDPPALLPEMLRAVREAGYDSAAARRVGRAGEPLIRSWLARAFYRAMRLFSDLDIVDGARDYRLMTRQMVSAVLALPEVNRFTKGLYQWVGFRTKWITFEHAERRAGETKWSLGGLMVYALEGMLSFSAAPLKVASWVGLGACGLSFVAMVFVVVRRLVWGDPVQGWASLMCVIVFLGGVQLFFTGVLGMYLAKTYSETKRRPLYFIKSEG